MKDCSLSTDHVNTPNAASARLQNTAVYTPKKLSDGFCVAGYNHNNEVCAIHVEDSHSFTYVDGDTQVDQAEARCTSQIGSWVYNQPQYAVAEGFNSVYLSGSGQDLQELPPELQHIAQSPDPMPKALDGASIGLPGLASKALMPQAQPVPARVAWQNDSAGHIAGLSASGDTLEDPSSVNKHQSLEDMRMKHQPPGRITRKVRNYRPICCRSTMLTLLVDCPKICWCPLASVSSSQTASYTFHQS